MNDRQTIAIYTQLVRFQSDIFSEETVFVDPDSSLQRTIHELAHRLGLEFEFSLLTRSARITRPVSTKCCYTTDGQASPSFTTNWVEDLINGFHDEGQIKELSGTAVGNNGAQRMTPSAFRYPDLPPRQVDQESVSIISDSNYSSYCGTVNTSPAPDKLANPITSTVSTRGLYYQSSVNSISSRRSNSGASACSEFKEIVFDTRSGRSVCSTSTPSVRRGTMDSTSREAMKAVKAVGACWRCKFLRKTVSALDSNG